MHGTSLKRAERLGQASGLLWTIGGLAVASALLVPMLVVDLGLILQHLVVTPGSGEMPRDWVLGPVGGLLNRPALVSGTAYLVVLVAIGWLLGLLDAAARITLHRLVHRYALRVATALRRSIHDQTFVLGPHDLLGVSRSRPEELFAERCEVVRRGLVRWWAAIPKSVVQLGLLLLLALMLNFWLTLLVLLLALYILPVARRWRRYTQAREDHWCREAEVLASEVVGSLRLAPLAIGYSLEWPPGDRFDQTLKQYAAAQFKAYTSDAFLVPVLLLVMIVSVSFVLLIVGIAHGTSVATTVVWGTVLLAAYFPAARLFGLRARAQEAEQAAGEMLAYLDRQPSVVPVAAAQPLDRITQDIKLDKVTIANRDGRRLLDDVSLTIPAGQTAVIVSSDSQTPLAIAGLFLRFYDAAAGRILYDGRDIGQATLETVRGQAVLVMADGPLFSGTVSDNLMCGRTGFTALQIGDAIRRAQAEDAVRALPEGLATPIGRGDPRLREDQAFRLGLARALLREPSLLIAQEPGGILEETASHQLDTALKLAAQGRTLLILAGRLSTLRQADCIYLFHDAALHAQGKHADLLQSSDLYRHLNYLWFNPFRENMSG